MQNDGIESLHSDWQALEQVCRLWLLLELGGDHAPQLSKEVNSRFIDRSQCLYSDRMKKNEAGRSEYLTSFLEAAASAAAAAVTEEAGR